MGCMGLYGVGCAVGDYKGMYGLHGAVWAVWDCVGL